MAKQFFYASLGVMCLAGAFHLGAVTTRAQDTEIADVVTAREFRVVDELGGMVGSLSRVGLVIKGGSVLVTSEAGAPSVMIVSGNEETGGSLTTFGVGGEQTATLGQLGIQAGMVTVVNKAGGLSVVILGDGDVGMGSMSTFDGAGNKLLLLGSTADGEGAIASFDRTGAVKRQWP